MAGPGRPRTPTAKLQLQGTFREDRHAGEELRPDGLPTPIAELEGYAKELWDRVVPELVRMKIATALDSAELFAMCEWWSEYRKLQANREMDLYNRACAMAASYKQFRTIASRFGLTPADRAGLDIAKSGDDDNPFAAFLRGQAAPMPAHAEENAAKKAPNESRRGRNVRRGRAVGKTHRGKTGESRLPAPPGRSKGRKA